jgi:hypothetical protein
LQAQRDAYVARRETLADLAAGRITIHDVIRLAGKPAGKPLRKITLRKLLTTRPGGTGTAADETLLKVAFLLDLDPKKLAQPTVAWLLHFNTGGRRTAAWLHSTFADNSPWDGFPYTPRPSNPKDH